MDLYVLLNCCVLGSNPWGARLSRDRISRCWGLCQCSYISQWKNPKTFIFSKLRCYNHLTRRKQCIWVGC